jgi:hypothetical protein
VLVLKKSMTEHQWFVGTCIGYENYQSKLTEEETKADSPLPPNPVDKP